MVKVNVFLVYSLRKQLPGPWGLYICILEKLWCHLNASNSVAFGGITDFSGRDIGKHCSKDTPLLTQLSLYQRLSWVIPTLQKPWSEAPRWPWIKICYAAWNSHTQWPQWMKFCDLLTLSEWLYHYCCHQHSWVWKALHTAWDRLWENQNSLGWNPPISRAVFHLFFPLQQEGRMIIMLKDQQLSPSHPIHVVEHPLCGLSPPGAMLGSLHPFHTQPIQQRDHTAQCMWTKIQLLFTVLCISRSELHN